MSNLRQAAQQALEAMKNIHLTLSPESVLAISLNHRITDLRAALAEQKCEHGVTDSCKECYMAEEQEPVAWMYDCGNGGRMYAEELDGVKGWMPLYTAPPQRKPLSDEHPLMVFAKECVLGAYSEKELADAANRAIKYAHSFKVEA